MTLLTHSTAERFRRTLQAFRHFLIIAARVTFNQLLSNAASTPKAYQLHYNIPLSGLHSNNGNSKKNPGGPRDFSKAEVNPFHGEALTKTISMEHSGHEIVARAYDFSLRCQESNCIPH